MNLPCTLYLYLAFIMRCLVAQIYDNTTRFNANKFATFALWKIGGYKQLILIQMEEDLLHNWEKKSSDHQKLYKQYLHRADKRKVLKLLPDLHEEAFEKINCLTCANCCKTYSPRFKTPDIKRIAKYLKMKEGDTFYIRGFKTG